MGVTAIDSSASIGNEIAIPHLHKLIEKGDVRRQLASIKAVSRIMAPSSINMLLKYYELLPSDEIRLEILRTVNIISPNHKEIINLNKSILSSINDKNEALNKLALEGLLISSENLNYIKRIFPNLPDSLKKFVFKKILILDKPDIPFFIDYFMASSKKFTPETLGYYLAGYQLKAKKPLSKYILERLNDSREPSYISFLHSIIEHDIMIEPLRIVRTLLRLPYINIATETMIGKSIQNIVDMIRKKHPYLINELHIRIKDYMEALFGKINQGYISLKGILDKNTLLIAILANLIENYASKEILRDMIYFLKANHNINPAVLIKKIRMSLSNATVEEKNRFEACMPLFQKKKKNEKMKILNTISKVNFERPSNLRSINRLIRIAGIIKLKVSINLIQNILSFARREKISFLEETSIVTLCQLFYRKVINEAREYLSPSSISIPSTNGYLRGLRFLPPEGILNTLLKLLITPSMKLKSKEIILDSIEYMNLKETKGIWPVFVKTLMIPELDFSLKEKISDIIIKNGDASIIQILLELTGSNKEYLKIFAVRALKSISLRLWTQKEVLVNRFYLLLEDESTSVRIEALLALIAFKDDYAIQIFEDYLTDDDKKQAIKLLNSLEIINSRELLILLLKHIDSQDKALQKVLREVLKEKVKDEFKEEIRTRLMDEIKQEAPLAPKSPVKLEKNNIINHAKLEFKFKRENSLILTVLFLDIVGYTKKSSDVDMSTLLQIIKTFESIVLPVIDEFKGNLIKKMGDGMLITFKHPLNAAISSLKIQKGITEYNQYKVEKEKFQVRIGINTGPVIRKDNDIYGDVVNIASRMETSANPGDVLLTHDTYKEISNYIKCTKLGEIHVKGKTEAITAYSAEEIKVDINNILKSKDNNKSDMSKKGSLNAIAILKESSYSPKFTIPENSIEENKHLPTLRDVFKDLVKASSEITKDYHEEYVFNRYLQSKWNQIITTLQ